MKGRIQLTGMKFFAHHGWYPEEREKGSWFSVDTSFDCDITSAVETDELSATHNYEEVYNIIKEEMNIPSKLIEHLVGRIHKRLLQIPGIESLVVTVYKLEAPL